MPTPAITAICPTYGRQKHLLENTLACFAAQTMTDSRLLIIDDLGNLAGVRVPPRVSVVSTSTRFPSLPAKYNSASYIHSPYLVVWEDDDFYGPRHLENAFTALQRHQWIHPVQIVSTYTGRPEWEPAAGRFHASLGFRRDSLWGIVGGWPETDRPDFDQQLMALSAQKLGPPGDYNSQYTFRWSDTGSVHGQHLMGARDEWYRRHVPESRVEHAALDPVYDESGLRLCAFWKDRS